ncbi:hypothetical protein ACRE_006700 [Hapsidospora chrysogenum ATCC 11550]|uniref:Uncharacterized protein n=1 Tax=Hapsidospora chrysogenum (strain ATCC 11550 / CBS 779.69 / DSM 880 / IAM 14645 / JCM 23072 / IMI 49137) TaxID=857340 RepID=A0A086TGN5_HAPC1|nr:hypothetical protein ACRE_006700 [Hapsidospora chrysogenum ATCC 11550]
MFRTTLVSLALAAFAAAAPLVKYTPTLPQIPPHVGGLSFDDCQHMANIGMAGMGDNVFGNNGYIWVGNDGPNTFTFTNRGSAPTTLILWDNPQGDYESSFMNVRRPKVSYSLPNSGDSVTISLGNGISGGWSTLTGRATTLSRWGQIYNTWGEFTTGDWATVDVSRLVNMRGDGLSVRVATGCLTNMDTCSFHCKNNANECGESGTYDLVNCDPATNPFAAVGTWDGINPEGGCQGWTNGGHLDVSLGTW